MKNNLVLFGNGIRLDHEGACGEMPDGCGIYRVLDPGTSLPRNTTHVGLHSRAYGCPLARDDNRIDPHPVFAGPCAHGLTTTQPAARKGNPFKEATK